MAAQLEKHIFKDYEAGNNYHDLVKIYCREIEHGEGDDVNRTLSKE
jgi:hypothetical protein